ncbi:MAG: 50S ribosomal protein L13 [Candidatus Micrarchaeia archaeon]
MLIIDGKDAILGRVATRAAKAALNGERVIVVNAEDIIITGKKSAILSKYKARRSIVMKANPEHAPHWPRRPDMLVRRIIRGMLPFDKPRGRAAFKRITVYVGLPDELKGKEMELGEKKNVSKFMRVIELSKELGWNA